MQLPFERNINTAGDGLWSDEERTVKTTELELLLFGSDFGELRVYFDKATWNINEHGLVYTDQGFIQELRKRLTDCDLDSSDVDYSEQGMQGDDYVSFDVEENFIDSWTRAGYSISD